ncbi:MAG: hypothetical protein WA964_03005 [Ilumatobacter sp.]|uniref:hypothetical protein n=1 Tax=Ilumatobacter sp. TaxID=1967498 RepID=UPI003C71578A
MKITTPKVTDLEPTWAPFRGWTILFDNPDLDLGPSPVLLETPVDTTGNRVYATLQSVAQTIAENLPDAPIAWLPPTSFHVTVMDGISGPHLGRMQPGDVSRQLAAGFDRLPDSLVTPHDLTAGHDIRSVVSTGCSAPIRFELDAVRCRGHAVLAELRSSVSSEPALARLDEARRISLGDLGASVGLDLVTEWRPHVTLGYVVNRDVAAASSAEIEHIAAQEIEGFDDRSTTISFSSVSLYGFTDMASYWR